MFRDRSLITGIGGLQNGRGLGGRRSNGMGEGGGVILNGVINYNQYSNRFGIHSRSHSSTSCMVAAEADPEIFKGGRGRTTCVLQKFRPNTEDML